MFFDFDTNFDVASNDKFDNNKDVNNKTSINATIVAKIPLNKKDRIIASETSNCDERRLSNERFEAIQKERQIKEKKKTKLLVLKELHVNLYCCLRQ